MKEWFRNGQYVPAAERLPPRPCGCGRCGLTIPRTPQHRARRWAEGCPVHGKWRRWHTLPPSYPSRR